METYKDFAQEHRKIRENFDPLLKLHEVRKILDVGREFVLRLIEEGELEAVDLAAHRPHEQGNGIRITPTSPHDYITRNSIN